MSLLDLTRKKGFVVGIANATSIAYGCAKAFHAAGANLAITYLDAKAEPYMRPPAEKLAALDSAVPYMAAELGPKGIRVHAISPGPLKTAQGAGIVLGARIPIILTSRADTVLARMASCAVALIAARRRERASP
jgi:enoyl-[acyl-carrier-protein] reductase (NADH)